MKETYFLVPRQSWVVSVLFVLSFLCFFSWRSYDHFFVVRLALQSSHGSANFKWFPLNCFKLIKQQLFVFAKFKLPINNLVIDFNNIAIIREQVPKPVFFTFDVSNIISTFSYRALSKFPCNNIFPIHDPVLSMPSKFRTISYLELENNVIATISLKNQ